MIELSGSFLKRLDNRTQELEQDALHTEAEVLDVLVKNLKNNNHQQIRRLAGSLELAKSSLAKSPVFYHTVQIFPDTRFFRTIDAYTTLYNRYVQDRSLPSFSNRTIRIYRSNYDQYFQLPAPFFSGLTVDKESLQPLGMNVATVWEDKTFSRFLLIFSEKMLTNRSNVETVVKQSNLGSTDWLYCEQVAIEGTHFTLTDGHAVSDYYKLIDSPVLDGSQLYLYMWESFWNGKEYVDGKKTLTLEEIMKRNHAQPANT